MTTRKGGAVTGPPPQLMADATKIVAEWSKGLPRGAKGGIVGAAVTSRWPRGSGRSGARG